MAKRRLIQHCVARSSDIPKTLDVATASRSPNRPIDTWAFSQHRGYAATSFVAAVRLQRSMRAVVRQ
jgi:hypothetical protein